MDQMAIEGGWIKMRNRVSLAGREFSSLTAAQRYAKSILDKYEVGDRVSDEEKIFLIAAIALRGPDKLAEKTGSGIDYIYVKPNIGGDNAFYIRRIDGSETDFSYKKCFKGVPTTPFTDFSNACRNAIKEEKAELKTGLGYDSHQVHHEDKTFKSIVQAFIEKNKLDLTAVRYRQGDGVEGRYFEDERIARDFNEFHNQMASLRVVSDETHKKLHRRKQKGVQSDLINTHW